MKLTEERIEYKGYVGEIAYDDCFGTFRASVVNTYPYSIADAEAWDIESLQKEFAVSIDIYLEACEEDGHPPIPPGDIVDYDALDEEFHRNPPQWYQNLMAKLADDPAEASPPTPTPQNGARQTETAAPISARARDMV